jgi:hypothetical protein
VKSKVKRGNGTRAELSRVEFAESKGWQPSYITKLIKQERLVLTKDGKRIDVAASERRLKATERVDKQGVREHHARKRKGKTEAAPSAPAPPAGASATPPAGAEPEARNSDPTYDAYNASRAKREAALASMAEMDQRLRQAELVEVSQVRDAAARVAGIIARGFDQIPPRIAAVWATESDPGKREHLLIEELRRIQQEFADGVAAIAAEVKGE